MLAPGTELDSTEAAFQLSFKFRLWTTDDRRWGAWAAYTQQSQWQLYNDSGNASRPFRETNYMPELILSYKPALEWGGLQWNLLNLAFNHQSNGRSDTMSRSWNRLIASFGVEQGNLGLLARLWWRIPEVERFGRQPDDLRLLRLGRPVGHLQVARPELQRHDPRQPEHRQGRRPADLDHRSRCSARCAATSRCSAATANR